MLRALGFANDTYLYVASGEIYGGDETLRPLRELFPNFYTKEMLANEELKPFLPFSSRLAAIDYIVSDESDVFVTNNNGNMAKILAGRRLDIKFTFSSGFFWVELMHLSNHIFLQRKVTDQLIVSKFGF